MLEREPRAELQISRLIGLRCDLAKRRRCDGNVRDRKRNIIEHFERIGLDRQPQALEKRELAPEAEVLVEERRAVQRIRQPRGAVP